MPRRYAFIFALILCCPLSSRGQDAASLRAYETKYYILYTDVAADQVREVTVRMTKMAEEYHQRTLEFSGVIRERLPFYLYRTRAAYEANGGKPGTDGLFDGSTLRAVAREQLDDRAWHTIQHEGFHQFAHAVIGGDLPAWANEGLAEYFGEALFTGDGFVSGVIPQWRLKRVRDEIRGDKLLSLDRMMNLSLDEWNDKITIANYDQGWSMVQFLAHGENGKYQKAFGAYVHAVSAGASSENAWTRAFGNSAGFQEKWKKYWLDMADDPSREQYSQAIVARLTSFLARAIAQKQGFKSFDDFREAARGGKLKGSDSQWLPPKLLEDAMEDSEQMTQSGWQWTLISRGAQSQIRCVKDHKAIVGSFQMRGGEVVSVGTALSRAP